MSEEKITGVCLDIPTMILRAKNERSLDSLMEALKQNIGPCVVEYSAPKHHNEWISVQERLPSENQVVLGWDGIHCHEAMRMQHETDLESPYTLEFYIQSSERGYMHLPTIPITHWMPLPAPPSHT